MARNIMTPAAWAATWQERWWVSALRNIDEPAGQVGPVYEAATRLIDAVVGIVLALTLLPPAWLLSVAGRLWGLDTPVAETVLDRHGRPMELYRPLRIFRGRGRRPPVGRWSWVLNAPHLITGRIALVGPAPLLPAERQAWQYLSHARRRIRPGLVSLADIGGRPGAGILERLQLDQLYLTSRGPSLDLRLLVRALLREPLLAPPAHAA